MTGKIFIISGPAGVGKDTIIKETLKNHPDFCMVKSYTTRPIRKSDEANNRIFVSKEIFKNMVKNNKMLEWAKVHNWYYGRKKDDIVRHVNKGKNIIIEVNTEGTKTYKKILPNTVTIFIKYKDVADFEKRLRTNRPEITEEELKIRCESMTKELEQEKYYDYSVINYENRLEKTIKEVEKIILENK